MIDLRIPFIEAISDDRLMGGRFFGLEEDGSDGLSVAQQVILKSIYGCPLSTQAEMDLFAAQQGRATYDDLGFITKVDRMRYQAKKYREAWVIGGRRVGKALALSTPIRTPTGFRALGELAVGDIVFDKDGNETEILFESPIFTDHLCFQVTFSGGDVLVADAGHKWLLQDGMVVTTEELRCGDVLPAVEKFDLPPRTVENITAVPCAPVKCIGVASPSKTFLAGISCIPTHNSDAIASTIAVYEACFGGHEAYLRRGQKGYCYQIAQDTRMAAYALHFVYATIKSSPVATEMLLDEPTADEIRLKNNMVIKVLPPTLKSVRGFACPVAILDEVGVWYQEADSANPDFEIYNAIRPAQMQFPDRLTVGISSPYNKSGLLWKNYEAGTEGKHLPADEQDNFRDVIVIHVPTGAGGNPRITREALAEEQRRDPKAFEREVLAIFQDSISGFLNSALVSKAVMRKIEELPADGRYTYVAALDPAFRNDAFAFTIFHIDDSGRVVQDVVRQFKPKHGEVNNPEAIFSSIVPLLRDYQIVTVYSDQYHLESLQQLAFRYGFLIEGVPFKASNKAQIYGSLQQLLNQGRLSLLDNAECVRELKQLERRLTQGGVVQISAPPGLHDDLAAVTAICAYKCLWLMPKPIEDDKDKDLTVHQRIQQQIDRKRMGSGTYSAWD